MKKLTVLGIGSCIMGDDGIGVYIVEELMKHNHMPEIEYVAGETDIDHCLQYVDAGSHIVIIDAAMTGKRPGTVTEFTINGMNTCKRLVFSAHSFSLTEALYCWPDSCNVTVLGIEPAFVGFRFGLSKELNIMYDKILDEVKSSISLIYETNISNSDC